MYFNVHCTFIHYFIHIFTIVKVIFDTLITLISLKCKRDEDDNLSQSDFVFALGSNFQINSIALKKMLISLFLAKDVDSLWDDQWCK